MISGALLGNKEEVASKNIKRIARIICIIVIMQMIHYILLEEKLGFRHLMINIYSKPLYNFWFLYAYLAILVLLPFLRKIILYINRKEVLYWIFLHVLFFCIIPIVQTCTRINDYTGDFNAFLVTSHNFFWFILGGDL